MNFEEMEEKLFRQWQMLYHEEDIDNANKLRDAMAQANRIAKTDLKRAETILDRALKGIFE